MAKQYPATVTTAKMKDAYDLGEDSGHRRGEAATYEALWQIYFSKSHGEVENHRQALMKELDALLKAVDPHADAVGEDLPVVTWTHEELVEATERQFWADVLEREVEEVVEEGVKEGDIDPNEQVHSND